MLSILKYPDERLGKISEPVTRFDENLHRLLDDMAATMRQAGGIGLAAPQVAAFERAFVIDLGAAEKMAARLYEFINPEVYGGQGQIVFDEGCLSLPGIAVPVRRYASIRVRYQDRRGTPRHLEAEGLLAVAIQHENDHLDGITTLDRVPFWKRYFLRKKLTDSTPAKAG